MSLEPCGKHINVVSAINRPISTRPRYTKVATPDGVVGGLLCEASTTDFGSPLVVCVHGIGSNARYFDLRSNSFAASAAVGGFPVLLIDRPGYGSSAAPGPGSAIDRGVEAITALVETVRNARAELNERPLVLVGHSFGGAVALTYVANQPPTAIAALCISGIGDRPASPYLSEMHRQSADSAEQLPLHWFFGPAGTYDRHGVTALRTATEPQRREEVQEIAFSWPLRWSGVVSKIRCPVHFRLAEFERIWQSSPAAIQRIGSAFIHAAQIDAAIAPGGGHLYEAHHRGRELVAAQIEFARGAHAKSD